MKRILNIIVIALIFSFILENQILAALPSLPADEGILLIDEDTNTIIYEQNKEVPFEPASTTKLLTALVLVDTIDNLDQLVTVGNEINEFTYADSRAMIWEGQQLTYRDLLYAMLVPSGNDAAQSIAVNVGKILANTQDKATAEAAFIKAMNQKASELGLTNSNFVNPHGRSNPNHYTTPEDYIKVTQAAFKNDAIKSAASAKEYIIKNQDGSNNVLHSSDYCLYTNSNDMAGYSGISFLFPNLVPGVVQDNPLYSKYINAAKTGSTDSNKRTYAFYSDQPNNNVYGVIFNCDEMLGIFSQSKELVEYLNENYQNNDISELVEKQKPEIENISILSPKELNIKVTETEIYDDKNNLDKMNVTYRFNEDLIKEENGKYTLLDTIHKTEKIGSALVNNSNGSVKTIPIYAENNYVPKTWIDYLIDNPIYPIIGIVLIILIIAIIVYRKRKNKKAENDIYEII